MDLGPVASAEELRWRAHTVFVPDGGADGDLVATLDTGEQVVLPLDVYTRDELAADLVRPPLSDGIGVAVVDHAGAVEDLHRAVQADQYP